MDGMLTANDLGNVKNRLIPGSGGGGLQRTGLYKRRYKQQAEQQIDGGEREIGEMQPALQKQNRESSPVAELFKHAGNHQGAVADGIGGDGHERDLPGERDTDRSVIEGGVRDGRRVLASNYIEHEIERGQNYHAPDASAPENNLGKFHFASCRLFSADSESVDA